MCIAHDLPSVRHSFTKYMRNTKSQFDCSLRWGIIIVLILFHLLPSQVQAQTAPHTADPEQVAQFLQRYRAETTKIHDRLYRSVRVVLNQQLFDSDTGKHYKSVETTYEGDEQNSIVTSHDLRDGSTEHAIIRGDAEYHLKSLKNQPLRMLKSQLIPEQVSQGVIETPRHRFKYYQGNTGLGGGLAIFNIDFYAMFTGHDDHDGNGVWNMVIQSISDCVEDGHDAIRVFAEFPPEPKRKPSEHRKLTAEYYFSKASMICFKYIERNSNKRIVCRKFEGTDIDNATKYIPKRMIATAGPITGGEPLVFETVDIVEFQKLAPDPAHFRLEQFGMPDLAELPPANRRSYRLLIILGSILGMTLFATVVVWAIRKRKPRATTEVFGERAGFTLLELLVVIAIVGVLTVLTGGAVQKVRQAAAKTSCQNRMRQLALASLQYHDAHNHLPPGHINQSFPPKLGELNNTGWTTHLLPYIEQAGLWSQTVTAFGQSTSIRANPPHMGLNTVVPTFVCPSDSRLYTAQLSVFNQVAVAHTSYQGVAGTQSDRHDGLLYNRSAVRLADVRDGTSSTVMIGERPPDAGFDLGWWYAGSGVDGQGTFEMVMGVQERDPMPITQPPCESPNMTFRSTTGFDDRCAPFHFWSLHPGGANFAFADGSVRFLSYSANAILPALATRAGGETVVLPD
jgi:prepilin-type N-terminal cleavage/methylation domain-containing protein/prepilin-type processing-associated H-X9-DG protein